MRWSLRLSRQAGRLNFASLTRRLTAGRGLARWAAEHPAQFVAFDVLAADERDQPPPEGLLPLTVNEARRLFTALIAQTAETVAHVLHWSRWRRRHQANARASHYRRRDHQPN